MKHFIIILFFLGLTKFSFATVILPEYHAIRADKVFLPLGKDKQISILKLSTISSKSFSLLLGQKLNLFQKLEFSLLQRKIKKQINKDGTLKSNALSKLTKAFSLDNESGFNLYGFSEGLLLGPLGVLSMYLNISKADTVLKHNRVKWAWIGFGVWAVLLLAIVLLLV
jgi:hypothetical protein